MDIRLRLTYSGPHIGGEVTAKGTGADPEFGIGGARVRLDKQIEVLFIELLIQQTTIDIIRGQVICVGRVTTYVWFCKVSEPRYT